MINNKKNNRLITLTQAPATAWVNESYVKTALSFDCPAMMLQSSVVVKES